MANNKIKALELASFNTTGLSGTYQVINSDGLQHPCVILRIVNDSNQDVTVSFDGSTDNDFVPTGTSLVLNGQSNALPNSFVANFSQGTKVYVKGSTGTGSIYLAGYYL